MMAAGLLLFLVIFLQEENCLSLTTLSQRERISLLRHALKNEIRNMGGAAIQEDTSEEEQDYGQSQKLPITPIMRLKKEKGKIRHSFKTTNAKMDTNDKMDTKAKMDTNAKMATKANNVNVQPDDKVKNAKNDTNLKHGVRNSSNLRSKNGTKTRISKNNRIRKPLEIFYRRVYDKDLINEPLEWVHCQDMITPFLTGIKRNITKPKRLNSKDATVQRILQLLKINTTSYGREDIYSIMYQISNLQLRLFQWELQPLNILLNILIKDHRHTFGYLKAGVRDLFNSWRMDISNITNILKQTRIFRPPCIQISKFDGSTKSPKDTSYIKKPETTTCDEVDDDC